MNDIRICPVCLRKTKRQITLAVQDRRMVCPDGHSFDLSSGGYVNLLPPSAGKHGDNKAMVQARRTLLDSEIYRPFCHALTEEIAETLPQNSILWDSGCGEGYYTSAIAACRRDLTVYASDLSTAALTAAHRRSAALRLTAASSYALPAKDSSADAVVCLFAPEALEEFRRILRPGGILIMGIPGRRHLYGLKEVLYTTPYENAPRDPSLPGFELMRERELHYSRTLNTKEQIGNLFSMTPYAYRTNAEGKERLSKLENLTTELHFHLILYKKNVPIES